MFLLITEHYIHLWQLILMYITSLMLCLKKNVCSISEFVTFLRAFSILFESQNNRKILMVKRDFYRNEHADSKKEDIFKRCSVCTDPPCVQSCLWRWCRVHASCLLAQVWLHIDFNDWHSENFSNTAHGSEPSQTLICTYWSSLFVFSLCLTFDLKLLQQFLHIF